MLADAGVNDSVATIRRLVAFYVDEHNRILPHSAFLGQTPDETYFGTGDGVPTDLTARATAARRARVEANRSASARRARHSTRPHDAWPLTAVRTMELAHSCASRRPPGEAKLARVSSVEGKTVSGIQTCCSSIGPCRLGWRQLACTSVECS